jgi:hypothetical protein
MVNSSALLRLCRLVGAAFEDPSAKSLWSVLFLPLSCSRLIALVDISGENRYEVVRLLLSGVGVYIHGLGLTPEG